MGALKCLEGGTSWRCTAEGNLSLGDAQDLPRWDADIPGKAVQAGAVLLKDELPVFPMHFNSLEEYFDVRARFPSSHFPSPHFPLRSRAML